MKSKSESCTVCEDGICRTKCPLFNGCPKEKPLHCGSGVCVTQYIDCAGYDMCPLNTPYRNKENICIADPFSQNRFFRDSKIDRLRVSLFPSAS